MDTSLPDAKSANSHTSSWNSLTHFFIKLICRIDISIDDIPNCQLQWSCYSIINIIYLMIFFV